MTLTWNLSKTVLGMTRYFSGTGRKQWCCVNYLDLVITLILPPIKRRLATKLILQYQAVNKLVTLYVVAATVILVVDKSYK